MQCQARAEDVTMAVINERVCAEPEKEIVVFLIGMRINISAAACSA